MKLNQLIQNQKKSLYKVSQESGVPYATLNELHNGKTKIQKCNAGTVYKLAKYFGVSMESMLEEEC